MTTATRNKDRRPPRLGDISFARAADGTWTLWRDDVEICRGLPFEAILELVRGEQSVDALANGNGDAS